MFHAALRQQFARSLPLAFGRIGVGAQLLHVEDTSQPVGDALRLCRGDARALQLTVELLGVEAGLRAPPEDHARREGNGRKRNETHESRVRGRFRRTRTRTRAGAHELVVLDEITFPTTSDRSTPARTRQ